MHRATLVCKRSCSRRPNIEAINPRTDFVVAYIGSGGVNHVCENTLQMSCYDYTDMQNVRIQFKRIFEADDEMNMGLV